MTDISHPLAGPWLATARHARILMVGTTCATGALPPSREFHQAGAALVSWIIAAAIVVVSVSRASAASAKVVNADQSIVGMTNSAPSLMPDGQRVVTVLVLV